MMENKNENEILFAMPESAFVEMIDDYILLSHFLKLFDNLSDDLETSERLDRVLDHIENMKNVHASWILEKEENHAEIVQK